MKSDIEDNLSEHLDADYVPEEGADIDNLPAEQVTVSVPDVPIDAQEKRKQADEDFQKGRKLLHRTAKSLEQALNNMDVLGNSIETAGFWAAYASVISQTGNLAKDMMELHQKKDHLSTFVDNPTPQGGIHIEGNAVVYTGSTADLQRKLQRDAQEAEEVIEAESE